MTINPVTMFRRAVCRLIGHDPFPSNPTVIVSRCWRCGDEVVVATGRTRR